MVIDDGQHPQRSAVFHSVVYEVEAPTLIRRRRCCRPLLAAVHSLLAASTLLHLEARILHIFPCRLPKVPLFCRLIQAL